MAVPAPRPGWLTKSLRGFEILGVVLVLAALMLWLGGTFSSDLMPSGTATETAAEAPKGTAPAPARSTSSRSRPSKDRSARTGPHVLAARAAGPVRTLLPKVGDTVLGTEPFGTLDATIYEAKVAVAAAALDAARLALETAATRQTLAEQNETAAAAELELARKEHARATKLSAEGSGTASELDVAVAKLRRAEAAAAEALTTIEAARKTLREGDGQITLREKELELAQKELSFTELRTEVGGVVVRRLVEPGSHASPGTPLLEVYDPADLRLDVPIRESLAPGLDRQASYRVRLPAIGRDVDARIVELPDRRRRVRLLDVADRSAIITVRFYVGRRTANASLVRLFNKRIEENKDVVPAGRHGLGDHEAGRDRRRAGRDAHALTGGDADASDAPACRRGTDRRSARRRAEHVAGVTITGGLPARGAASSSIRAGCKRTGCSLLDVQQGRCRPRT